MALKAILAATSFLGAFLLFQIQPILSKSILPWFGGGPAVWTACLLFFQTVLLAGYAYADLSERWLSGTARATVHGLLLAAGLLFLPRGVSTAPPSTEYPTASVVLLLAIHIGVPFFLLSTTGPLVQAWFARLFPDGSPYRLYALSNLGSLTALLTYPLVVEPAWGLREQLTLWRWGFGLYLGLAFTGAFCARGPGVESTGNGNKIDGLFCSTMIPWVVLSAFSSAMFVSTTEQLGHDIAVVPFLWVLPLAVYLLSFILAFDHPRWFKPVPTAALTVGLIFVTALFHAYRPSFPMRVPVGIGVGLGALFGICMLCHGMLAALKPAPGRLTTFYLCLAAGGALGSLFVSLAAPRMFSTLVEWGAGMATAYLAAWGLLAWICRGGLRAHLNLGAVLLVISVLGLAVILHCFTSSRKRLDVSRNFFGVTAVEEGEGYRDLMNGRILHGRQFLADPRKPTTYYVPESGIGRAMARPGSRRIGVVGLGAGCLAAYATQPAQTIRFYEINPDVKRMAETWFTYLKESPAKVEVVLGDARVRMERERPQEYDVLAVDAFTGDSIPTHLLTLEAMRLYGRHLAPDGVLAIHVSNRSIDLAPVVRGTAKAAGLRTVEILHDPPAGSTESSSAWVLCTRSDAIARELSAYGTPASDPREIVWTDDAATLLRILKLR